MTEESTELAAGSPVEPLHEPAGSDDPGTAEGTATDDPDVFPREYVERLRSENAEARVKAKRVDDLAGRLVTALVAQTGRLADPTDLAMTDALLDDDGYPDSEKVAAAVDDLLARKPHLASTRVAGDVGQGARGDLQPMVGLAELLRAGAG